MDDRFAGTMDEKDNVVSSSAARVKLLSGSRGFVPHPSEAVIHRPSDL
jgi:hypothetical protein